MREKLDRRSALAEVYQTGVMGFAEADGPGVRLAERRALAVVEIEAWPDTAAALVEALGRATGIRLPREPNRALVDERGGTAAIAVGPDRWLIVEMEGRDLYSIVRGAAGEDQAAVTDQGHARVGLRLQGRNARDLLAKGMSIDLRRSRFALGQAAATRLEHFAVVLHCLADDAFDLFVSRSYAASLYGWILDAALEFGCRIDDPI